MRRAVGASRNVILVQFLLEAVFLSFAGGVVGIVIGIGGTQAVSQLQHLPFLLQPEAVLTATLLSIGLGLLFWVMLHGRAALTNPSTRCSAPLPRQQIMKISARNFWRFRLQAALITLATMTGTAGVLVSTGYAAGGRQKILDQFARLGTNVIIVTPQQSRAVGGRARTGSSVTTLNLSDYKAIRQSVGRISSASPTVASILRVRAGDLTKNTTVVGCMPEYFTIKDWLPLLGDVFDERASQLITRWRAVGVTSGTGLVRRYRSDGEPHHH